MTSEHLWLWKFRVKILQFCLQCAESLTSCKLQGLFLKLIKLKKFVENLLTPFGVIMYHFFRFENDKCSCLDLRKLHWAAITFYCHFRQCHFRGSMSCGPIEGQVKVKSIIMKDNFMILQLKSIYAFLHRKRVLKFV